MTYGVHQAVVVFGYDGSDHAKAAIRQAALQLVPGRHAIVATVWRPIEGGEELAEVAEREARKLADEGATLAREVGFDAMPLVRCGHPVWRSLVDIAESVHASLIVVGSHGRTGLRRLLMGSVAAATVGNADCAVLVVHAASPVAANGSLRVASAQEIR
jgi:nucleotide-binding universal stress UspA family protein